MAELDVSAQKEASLKVLVLDAVESSAIEGERLDRDDVQSSVAKRLGLEFDFTRYPARHVNGIANVLIDAMQNATAPLTIRQLLDWHTELLPYRHIPNTAIGCWRGGDVRVVSGNIGTHTIHFEGVPAVRLGQEMSTFLEWLARTSNPEDGILRSGIAHLWFVTIHPFEDGNGRLARAIGDMVLTRDEGVNQRYYSMSKRLRSERSEYYRELEKAQRGTLDITEWLMWYLGCLRRAFDESAVILDSVLRKERFFRENRAASFNERQLKLVNILFNGLNSKLTAKKWSKVSGCSVATARRDIDDLIKIGLLKLEGAGPSAHYVLAVTKII